jgi:hypothetical protein
MVLCFMTKTKQRQQIEKVYFVNKECGTIFEKEVFGNFLIHLKLICNKLKFLCNFTPKNTENSLFIVK